MSGWLSNILDTIRTNKIEPPMEEPVLKPVGGVLVPPKTVLFEISCVPNPRGGLLFWAFSHGWNGCRGGDGFELGLSQSRLRVVDLDGNQIVDLKYTMPFTNGGRQRFLVDIDFLAHGVICRIRPQGTVTMTNPDKIVQLQALTPLGKTMLWAGTGDPPGPGKSIKDGDVTDFRIV